MVRQSFVHILVTALLASSTAAFGAESAKKAGAKSASTAGNTQFLMFGMKAGGSYDVRQNGSLDRSVTASPGGGIDMDDSFTAGDQYTFTLTGVQPVTPSPPSGVSANGSTNGCATVAWDAPAPAEYVSDYRLLWRRGGTAFTDSVAISMTDIVQSGGRWSTTRCGLPDGTYTFALRAHNAFNLWSGRSNTANATVSNENTVGPPPPTNVAAAENPTGCLRVTWTKVGDPTVTTYRMYFATRPRSQGAYTDSVDVAASNPAVASRCGLAAGTYYAAVRSINSTGLKSTFSNEASVTLQGPDVTPPALSQQDPPNGATGVPTNSSIYFVVTDARSGINRNSISVRINNVTQSTGTAPVTNGYAVEVTAPTLPASSTVTVSVTVSDGASPANTLNASWSFTTGASANNDVTPPVCSAASPAAGATGVPANTTVEVNIADTGLGVALGSVRLSLNGASVAFTVTGTPANVRLTHRPTRPFAPGTEVVVRVEGCDRASPANCAQPLDYSFIVGGSVVASESQGDIVPDGYWAGEPAKPLEVRNLPRAWEVHIFDAAGFAVRRFGSQADGFNWTWDFTNDGGQRVAPALYLVRVTDASGALQRTGRFVVQSSR